MLEIAVPPSTTLRIEHVVLDYNGTVSVDGALVEGVAAKIRDLSERVDVLVLTADTYGTAVDACASLPVRVLTFAAGPAAEGKAAIVRSLSGGVCCLGNGLNDGEMFDEADLAIAVLDAEGVCAALLPHADMLARSAPEALDLLLNTDRIKATLRG